MPLLPAPSTFRLQITARGIASFTLDRPSVKNALTIQTYEELRDTFRACAQQADIKAVVITGAGENFCSGGDVRQIIGHLLTCNQGELRAFNELTTACVTAMLTMPQIVVAAVDGVAAGGGAALAIGADLRVMSTRARIGFVFPKVGLCGGDMAASWRLPRLVGLARASELLLFGEFIDAQTALHYGLANRIVAADELQHEAHSWAERLAAGPLRAHARTKALLAATFEQDLKGAVAAEVEAQTACMQEPDFREGHAAFIEKRAPRWSGK